MDSRYFDEIVAREVGSELERVAKVFWYTGNTPWDDLTSFQKFTWLAFAKRRMERDI